MKGARTRRTGKLEGLVSDGVDLGMGDVEQMETKSSGALRRGLVLPRMSFSRSNTTKA